MQGDVVSRAARELLPVLRGTAANSERARKALGLLGAWQGAMTIDRPEPLIFNAWTREISRRIFADELGEELLKDYWEQRNMHLSMVHALSDTEGASAWCGDARKKAAEKNTCPALASAALESALDDLTRRYGSNMDGWRWGEAHVAHSEHRPFSRVGWLAPWFEVRVPSPGDTYTVNVGRNRMRDDADPYSSRHAAGLRTLYDLANLENSRFIQSTGQSGNPLSPLYRSYAERWAQTRYLPMKTGRAAAEKDGMGTLRLQPAR